MHLDSFPVQLRATRKAHSIPVNAAFLTLQWLKQLTQAAILATTDKGHF